MTAKTFGGIVATLLLALIFAVQIFGGKDAPEAAPEPNPDGPVATLNPSNPTETTDPADPAPTETAAVIPDEVRDAQFKVASDYAAAYFSYSYKDKSPNAFIDRIKPYATPGHHHDLEEMFGGDDASLSNAWDDIRKERREVTINVSDTAYDPWYDPTVETAVVVVTYTPRTTDAVGNGGTGTEQTARFEVTKTANGYLVSNTVSNDSSAGI